MLEKTKEIVVTIGIASISIAGFYIYEHSYAQSECKKYGYTGENAGIGSDLRLYCSFSSGQTIGLDEAKSEWETREATQIAKTQEENMARIAVTLKANIEALRNQGAPTTLPPIPQNILDNLRAPSGNNCTSFDCSGHDAGRRWAESRGLIDPSDCRGNSRSFIQGCVEYVEENFYP